MTEDDLAELMAQEPGGENHGRTRNEGQWHSLDHSVAQSLEEHFNYMVYVPIHGTRDCYVNEGCRCKSCRRANAEYHRKRRGS